MNIKSHTFFENRSVVGDSSKEAKLVPDLFQIGKNKGQFIYYSSLLNTVYLVDKEAKDMIEAEDILAKFRNNFAGQNLLVKSPEQLRPICSMEEKFSYPRELFIFLTGKCNLRCKYCYAQGGEMTGDIDFKFVKAAVDYLAKKNDIFFTLSFHGGGEPTMAFDLMRKAVTYAKSRVDSLGLKLVTNGMFSKKTRKFLLENNFEIAVSIDGPPYIQNKQRPRPQNKKSAPLVEKTIKFFSENSPSKLSTLTTVSKFSVEKQEDVVKYLADLGVESMGFEPVVESGRSENPVDDTQRTPLLKNYARNFLKAKKEADKLGLNLKSSFLPLYKHQCAFCGASFPNLMVTPDGLISSCSDSYAASSDTADNFIYGRINNETGELKFDWDKIKYLQKRTVDNINRCKSCFLKWSCAGGCHLKAVRATGDMFEPERRLCETKRWIVREYLKYFAKENLLKNNSSPKDE